MVMEQEKRFKDRMKEAMEIRGVRAVDLSKATHITKSSISRYLSGEMEPLQDKLKLIADYLNVNYGWLMGYDTPMNKDKDNTLTLLQKITKALDNASYDEILKVYTYILDIGIIKEEVK